jgi:hypothetical protein
MVYLRTKNPNSGTFWRPLGWKLILYIQSFDIFYTVLCIFYGHLVFCTEKNLATLARTRFMVETWCANKCDKDLGTVAFRFFFMQVEP